MSRPTHVARPPARVHQLERWHSVHDDLVLSAKKDRPEAVKMADESVAFLKPKTIAGRCELCGTPNGRPHRDGYACNPCVNARDWGIYQLQISENLKAGTVAALKRAIVSQSHVFELDNEPWSGSHPASCAPAVLPSSGNRASR